MINTTRMLCTSQKSHCGDVWMLQQAARCLEGIFCVTAVTTEPWSPRNIASKLSLINQCPVRRHGMLRHPRLGYHGLDFGWGGGVSTC
jgi:hypothetical protein